MRLALILSLAPMPLIAQETLDFSGLWRANPTAQCVYTGGDGSALKIEDNTLFGVENRCDMTNPVNVNDMNAQLSIWSAPAKVNVSKAAPCSWKPATAACT